MDLKQYIEGSDLRIANLAEMLDCSLSHLYGVIAGRKKCGRLLARAIEKVTKGKVSYRELREHKTN